MTDELLTRRELLRAAALLGVGLALAGCKHKPYTTIEREGGGDGGDNGGGDGGNGGGGGGGGGAEGGQ